MSMTAYSVGIVCLGQALYGNGSVARSLVTRIEKTVELIDQFTSNNHNNMTMQLNKEVGKSNNNICLILSGADVAKVGISEARYMSECIQKRLRPINRFFSHDSNIPNKVILLCTSFDCCYFVIFWRSQVKIFLDENSTNTLGNALNCCKIISDQIMHTQSTDHIHHIALVTNEFHMPRAHLLFKSALRNSKVRIHAISAENGLAPGNEYR